MYKGNGLLYSACDEHGNKVGVAIKASAVYNKPTLANLEKQFLKNGLNRKIYKEMLKERLDKVMGKHPKFSKNDFARLLAQENIKILFRENKEGQLYGVTYIDQYKKSVINGSELGKAYAANGLSSRLVKEDQLSPHQMVEKSQAHSTSNIINQNQSNNLLENLLQGRSADDHLPGQLVKKRKRKKKQGHQLKGY